VDIFTSAIFTSNLPNDQDIIRELRTLGSTAVVPIPLFTDVSFAGQGDNGESLLIAVERKKIGDMASCISSGRLLAQLQASVVVGVDVLVVLVEGRVRRSPEDGLLEIPTWGVNPRTMKRCEMWQPVKPTTTYSRYCQYLFELERLAGVYVLRSEGVQETAAVIVSLWSWFQSPADGHQSLRKFYKRPPPTVQLVRPSFTRRVAAELDGIGWTLSAPVAQHLPSVERMVAASEEDWRTIPGIGKKLAKSAIAELCGGKV